MFTLKEAMPMKMNPIRAPISKRIQNVAQTRRIQECQSLPVSTCLKEIRGSVKTGDTKRSLSERMAKKQDGHRMLPTMCWNVWK